MPSINGLEGNGREGIVQKLSNAKNLALVEGLNVVELLKVTKRRKERKQQNLSSNFKQIATKSSRRSTRKIISSSL